MAGDIKLKYGTAVTLSTTAAFSLPTSSTRTAGYTTGQIDNTTTLALDYLITGQFPVSATTSSTNIGIISVHAYAVLDTTPTWPDLFSAGTEGTSGTATVHDEEQRDAGMVTLWSAGTDGGIGETFVMPPTSIAQAFGGSVPQIFAIFFAQSTAASLSTSNVVMMSVPVLAQYT